MSSAYTDQIEQKINTMLADKKYGKAYELCNEFLKKYPYKRRFLKLKRKIENAAGAENRRYIKTQLKEMKPLWREKNYLEILKQIRPLLKYGKKYPKLGELYMKAQIAYREQIKKLEEKYKKEQTKKFDKLLKEDQKKLIQELFNLEKNNPGNQIVKEIARKYRHEVIIQRINERGDLIYSRKYTAIENFLKELKKIDKNNIELKRLETNIHKRKFGTQIEEKGEYVYRGLQHIATLMKLKKYDKALQASEELLEVDKTNREIIKFLRKARSKNFKQTRSKSAKIIDENFPKLKEEYKKDKAAFIKL